jgi:hypothetical protein
MPACNSLSTSRILGIGLTFRSERVPLNNYVHQERSASECPLSTASQGDNVVLAFDWLRQEYPQALQLAQSLYERILAAGEDGINEHAILWPLLRELKEEGAEPARCIQHLLNFEVIVRVISFEEHRLVAKPFFSRWLPVLSWSIPQSPAVALSCASIRPWTTVRGSINTPFLSQLRRKIYGVIMGAPGITEVRIYPSKTDSHPFSLQETLAVQIPILGSAALKEVLQGMELDGVVFVRCLSHHEPSLFTPEEMIPLPSQASQPRTTNCYFVKFNTLPHL